MTVLETWLNKVYFFEVLVNNINILLFSYEINVFCLDAMDDTLFGSACKRWDWKTQFLGKCSRIAIDSSGACCLFCALLRVLHMFKNGTIRVKCKS